MKHVHASAVAVPAHYVDVTPSVHGLEGEARGPASLAISFLQSHEWCQGVTRLHLAETWDGILSVLLAEVTGEGADPFIWVVVGDLAPAYISLDYARNVAEVLEAYVAEMRAWVDAVRAGHTLDDLIPVCAARSLAPLPPSVEVAELLETRLNFIEEHILPQADRINLCAAVGP